MISNLKPENSWQEMKRGNVAAFEYIFKTHYVTLYHYGLHFCKQDELVKDVIQDLFSNIWERRQQLGEVNSIIAYLISSLRRALLLRLRKSPELIDFDVFEMTSSHLTTHSPEDVMIKNEALANQEQQFNYYLKDLPSRTREALYLKFYKNLSYVQIAEIMDISYQVARNYVSDGLQRIRKIHSIKTSVA